MDEGFNEMITSKATAPNYEEFKEEDVWAVNLMKEREGSSLKTKRAQEQSSAPAPACRIPPVPKVIKRVNSGSQQQSTIHNQSSAPVNIPDWSKIYPGTKSDDALSAAAANVTNRFYSGNAVDDDDDEDSDEMLPPHEFIARRLARNPVVSYSMCEGVGRTLKGRDLSKLRNAILTKTGFLE